MLFHFFRKLKERVYENRYTKGDSGIGLETRIENAKQANK